ncbi:MAG: FG-GAP-like repeat-containing protein [Planctomycetaceae bacterium]|nr:FG-GAP-like repeat-containing protein [Planctomycetaceae bacterium]
MSTLLCSLLVALCATTVAATAGEPRFRVHPIDPESANSSSAVIDVNCDGKLDVVAGGWWYEAPAWNRHFVREVEVIRGRNDDYSNLPLDVNGDGRLDLISANYRSGRIYWIEQPADANAPWTTHLAAEPGRMETARLADMNGDGRLDLLPNGVDWAAWWEIRTRSGDDGRAAVSWIRHDLPREVAGHGVGSGDINGDGRLDVVSSKGWAEAPADSNGAWTFRPEFRLHRDACIPILVFDVDHDGDADVVWSRGHGTGIYWLEQSIPDGVRTWTKHVIDASWSQPHTLMLADITADGVPEVITGKRYLAHEGKDAGEWDPLIVCAYRFQNESRTWTRTVLSSGERVGWDLDPKAADLDADGDVDLVCPGRSGLYWLENLGTSDAVDETLVDTSFVDDLGIPAATYPDHRQPLWVHPPGADVQPVAAPGEWGRRRGHLRANMQLVMGRLPDPSRRVPLDVEVVSEEPAEGYVRRKIRFTSEPGDRVPAWLLLPKSLGDAPQSAPAMLCLHQTTGIGKDEPAGLEGLPNLHYAHELAQRGYVCIVPDYPSFGEYPYDFKTQGGHYPSGSMKAIWNNLRGVDVLEQIPQVNPDRIGVIGHSLGGHNALFTAVFDLRLKAVVSSCGFTAFHHYYGGKLAGWTSDRYMPRIRDVYHNSPDEVPFDFPEMLAAIAPRAFFSNSPIGDGNFDVTGVRLAFDNARPVYQLLEVPPSRLRLETPDAGHDFPPAIREAAYAWLGEILK